MQGVTLEGLTQLQVQLLRVVEAAAAVPRGSSCAEVPRQQSTLQQPTK